MYRLNVHYEVYMWNFFFFLKIIHFVNSVCVSTVNSHYCLPQIPFFKKKKMSLSSHSGATWEVLGFRRRQRWFPGEIIIIYFMYRYMPVCVDVHISIYIKYNYVLSYKATIYYLYLVICQYVLEIIARMMFSCIIKMKAYFFPNPQW